VLGVSLFVLPCDEVPRIDYPLRAPAGDRPRLLDREHTRGATRLQLRLLRPRGLVIRWVVAEDVFYVLLMVVCFAGILFLYYTAGVSPLKVTLYLAFLSAVILLLTTSNELPQELFFLWALFTM